MYDGPELKEGLILRCETPWVEEEFYVVSKLHEKHYLVCFDGIFWTQGQSLEGLLKDMREDKESAFTLYANNFAEFKEKLKNENPV